MQNDNIPPADKQLDTSLADMLDVMRLVCKALTATIADVTEIKARLAALEKREVGK